MRPLSGVPESAEVPQPVRELAGGSPLRPVWQNEVGGLTFEIGSPEPLFVKWSPHSAGIDLGREADRLAWAAPFTPVPRLVDRGSDDDASWLVTEALPGENAVTERWRADPATAVVAIGEGLRALHDALPAADCPFTWSVGDRLPAAHLRAAVGDAERRHFFPDHADLTWDDVLARLADPPEVERLVVCHGDACAPNTLIADDGRWSGHVDLGALGTGDRWADVAVAAWSTEWNYGAGWTDRLVAAYGVPDDPDRRAWYRLLWDAT